MQTVPVNPKPFLNDLTGKQVICKLKWGMEYNVKKWKVMHFGRTNPKYEYRMNGTVLEVTTEERDLGVITMATTKPTAQ